MNNINNSKNVVGMCDILADPDEDLDIAEIELSISQGLNHSKKDDHVDMAKKYSNEINNLAKVHNLEGFEGFDCVPNNDDNQSVRNDNMSESNDLDDLLGLPSSVGKNKYNDYTLTSVADDDDEYAAPTYHPSSNARPIHDEWSASKPDDNQLNRMTNEERKQDHVDKVLGGMSKNNDDATFVHEEDEEDEMARILEQVDLLRSNLESEGVDLSRIPDINSHTSKKEAKASLRILQIKNDRLRYCDFFEEGILAVAYGMEGIFDGQREIFGSRIDLTGYSDTVKVKLRRMRYDTSTFVSGIMQGYNISSGWRIVLELIPSLFLYSRDRKLTAKDNLISDESYKKAMQDLQ